MEVINGCGALYDDYGGVGECQVYDCQYPTLTPAESPREETDESTTEGTTDGNNKFLYDPCIIALIIGGVIGLIL